MKKVVLIILVATSLFMLTSCQGNKEKTKPPVMVYVYLDADATDDEVDKVEKDIRKLPGIISCEFVSKEQAYKEIVDESGVDPQYFEEIGNPLPHMFVVEFEADAFFGEKTKNILEKIENVDTVKK